MNERTRGRWALLVAFLVMMLMGVLGAAGLVPALVAVVTFLLVDAVLSELTSDS